MQHLVMVDLDDLQHALWIRLRHLDILHVDVV